MKVQRWLNYTHSRCHYDIQHFWFELNVCLLFTTCAHSGFRLWMIRSREWDVAHMVEMRNSYKILVGKPKGKTHLEDPGVHGGFYWNKYYENWVVGCGFLLIWASARAFFISLLLSKKTRQQSHHQPYQRSRVGFGHYRIPPATTSAQTA
jgi:hypothetical protein